MKPMLEDALARGYGVPSFCVWNAESVRGVLQTAVRLKSPVILMAGPGEFPLVDIEDLATIVRAFASDHPLPAALHLDHGNSLEQVRRCLDAGFTSVMLDYSTRSFDENAAALREVVAMAHPHGVTVEGEIGAVGRVDDTTVEGTKDSRLTDPEEAFAYVEATRVDALAVGIGNAHGIYTKLPRFDFERLAAIRKLVNVPLVLHGGSGTPEPDLKRAIGLGMVKVNVASEIIATVRQSLLDQWGAQRNGWTPAALAEAMQSTPPVLERWIRRLGADGRA